MYKVTGIILLAIGIMAFNKPTDISKENSNLKMSSHVLDATKMDIYTNENRSKNNIVFDQKDKEKEQKGNNAHQKKEQHQGKKDNGNQTNEQHHGKKDNGNQKVDKHVSNKHDNGNKGHVNKKQYEKGHPNFNYVYVNKHGYYSHKNYGQWRSEQAKMKHKKYHPVYEYEAIEGFKLIQTRNVFLYDETDYKINLLNLRLAEKRKANQIDPIEYDRYSTRIVELQEKRAALNININL